MTPAQEGHAGLPAAAACAASVLVARLASTVGRQSAVAWVHTGAVLHWAHANGLIADGPAPTVDGVRKGLDQLAAVHPALAEFTDPATVAVWEHDIDDHDVQAITELWAQHPPLDPPYRPHGYLLGNAYQAICEEARKHRALAQTPRFITGLLHALAFDPALEVHGSLHGFRMIDPSCGTGHILIESLLHAHAWTPAGRDYLLRPSVARVEAALDAVRGVDLDPYAALIARLRLVVMASVLLRVSGGSAVLPVAWPVHVAAVNALLGDHPLLARGSYHAVIANPPYVTPKTAKERDAIRKAYPEVCHGSYALSLPFHQLSTDLPCRAVGARS